MRTTLTLDPDVARLIEEAVHRERRPFKQVVNDALRRGLTPAPSGAVEPYELVPHESSLRAGLDLSGFNRLADELEDDAILARSLVYLPCVGVPRWGVDAPRVPPDHRPARLTR